MRKTLEMRKAILLRHPRPRRVRRALGVQLHIHMSLPTLTGPAHRPSPPRLSILTIHLRGRRRRPGGGSRRSPCPECHQPGMLVLEPVQSCARWGEDRLRGWAERRQRRRVRVYPLGNAPAARGRMESRPSGLRPYEAAGYVPSSAPPMCLRLRGRGNGELYYAPAPPQDLYAVVPRPAQPRSMSFRVPNTNADVTTTVKEGFSARSLHPRPRPPTGCIVYVSEPARRVRTACAAYL